MKATEISYEKTFNLGNYQNEVIGVKVQLEEGDNVKQAILKASEFVNSLNAQSREGFYISALKKAMDYPLENNDDVPF